MTQLLGTPAEWGPVQHGVDLDGSGVIDPSEWQTSSLDTYRGEPCQVTTWPDFAPGTLVAARQDASQDYLASEGALVPSCPVPEPGAVTGMLVGLVVLALLAKKKVPAT